MARRYHINPKTGRPNICRAQTPERCEYAKGDDIPEHYDTKEEAREAYAKSMSDQTVSTVTAGAKGTTEEPRAVVRSSSSVGEFVKIPDSNYYEMRATRDIPSLGVKKGDTGGWVVNPDNIQGNAWVAEGASVIGPESVVKDNAVIGGNGLPVVVAGRSVISDDALVVSTEGSDLDAVVTDSVIRGRARMYGGTIDNSRLWGDTQVTNCVITNESSVGEYSKVTRSVIDKSAVSRSARVEGSRILNYSTVTYDSAVFDSVVNESWIEGEIPERDAITRSDIRSSEMRGGANNSVISKDSFVDSGCRVESSSIERTRVMDGATVALSNIKAQGSGLNAPMTAVEGHDLVQNQEGELGWASIKLSED